MKILASLNIKIVPEKHSKYKAGITLKHETQKLLYVNIYNVCSLCFDKRLSRLKLVAVMKYYNMNLKLQNNHFHEINLKFHYELVTLSTIQDTNPAQTR